MHPDDHFRSLIMGPPDAGRRQGPMADRDGRTEPAGVAGGMPYAVSNAAITIAAAGGTGRFDVIQASDPNSCGGPLQNACLWTATSDVPWITITTSMPQRGDNAVSFTVSPNSSGVARTGRITVRDQVVVVTQPGELTVRTSSSISSPVHLPVERGHGLQGVTIYQVTEHGQRLKTRDRE